MSRQTRSQCAAAEAADPQPVGRTAGRSRGQGQGNRLRPDPAQPQDPFALDWASARKSREIASTKPNIDLDIQFDYNSAEISTSFAAVCAGARQGALESQPEGFDLRGRRPHRRDRRRSLQPGPLRTPRRHHQALPDRRSSASPAPISSPSAMARTSRRIRTRRWTRSTAASRSSTWTPRPRRSNGRTVSRQPCLAGRLQQGLCPASRLSGGMTGSGTRPTPPGYFEQGIAMKNVLIAAAPQG